MSWLWIAGALWTIFLVACGVSLVALLLSVLEWDHQRRLANMRRNHEAEMRQIWEDHERRMTETRRNHERNMAGLRRDRIETNLWTQPAVRAEQRRHRVNDYENFQWLVRNGFEAIYEVDDEGSRVHPITPEATTRSKELLRSHLTPMQRHQLDNHNQFEVAITYNGVHRRFIVSGGGGYVYEVNGHRLGIALYCIGPRFRGVPSADIALAQKLLLETDRDAFFRTANKTSL